MIKYTIPGIPPSMNKYKGRRAEHEYRSDKELWEKRVNIYCRPRPTAPIPRCTLEIKSIFRDRRRRDPNNYDGQFITDGLTKARIIADDSFDCIELKLTSGYDKDNPRTEIYITPAVEAAKRITIDILDPETCIVSQGGTEIVRTNPYAAAKYIEVLLRPNSQEVDNAADKL